MSELIHVAEWQFIFKRLRTKRMRRWLYWSELWSLRGGYIQEFDGIPSVYGMFVHQRKFKFA